MGNGQSGSGTNGEIPTSASFLSNKTSNPKAKGGKVIVVRQGTNAAGPSSDELIKRFSEIPKFYPILKGALNQPGLRDPPEAVCKISARPILKLCYRLQQHLSHCAHCVSEEQESLTNAVKDVTLVDRSVAGLVVKFSGRKKSFDRFHRNLERIGDLQAHISSLRFFFQDLIPMVETLNEILPEKGQLSALNISHLVEEKDISKEQ
ncbi:unnamed protein product, partial [Gongylonema pulchrum]|uniref:BLOC-1-related complex subunit 5 n=1 Tax=Gongylonema pulchrum TaxID=637853 RepID=A0A183EED9_9BILA